LQNGVLQLCAQLALFFSQWAEPVFPGPGRVRRVRADVPFRVEESPPGRQVFAGVEELRGPAFLGPSRPVPGEERFSGTARRARGADPRERG